MREEGSSTGPQLMCPIGDKKYEILHMKVGLMLHLQTTGAFATFTGKLPCITMRHEIVWAL
jgi:hypothetical protein